MRISDWSSDVCSSDLYAVESLQPCQSFRRHLIGCFFPCRNCGPFLVRLQLLVPSCNQGVYLALQKVYFRRTQFFMELQVVVPEIDEVAKNASAIHAVLRLQFSDRDAFQIWRPNLNPRHCYPPPTATCIVRCARYGINRA